MMIIGNVGNTENVFFKKMSCFVGYKVLNEDMTNYKKNFKYSKGKWFGSLDVDLRRDISCSYGINLFKDFDSAFNFAISCFYKKIKIFKCICPDIKENCFVFTDDNKFRTKYMYIQKEISLKKLIKQLGKDIKSGKCIRGELESFYYTNSENKNIHKIDNLDFLLNKNFDYELNWNRLTIKQKNYLFRSKYFKSGKFIKEIIRDDSLISNFLIFNEDFDFGEYWLDLSFYERYVVCYKVLNFDFKKHWKKLTEEEKITIAKYNKRVKYNDLNWRLKDIYLNNRTDLENYYEYFELLNVSVRKRYISREKNQDIIDLLWNQLTVEEKSLVLRNFITFDFIKYWDKLNKDEKSIICEFNENFILDPNLDLYKLESMYRRSSIINCKTFNYKKYWIELDQSEQNRIALNRKDFNFKKYYKYLTEKTKSTLDRKTVIEGDNLKDLL